MLGGGLEKALAARKPDRHRPLADRLRPPSDLLSSCFRKENTSKELQMPRVRGGNRWADLVPPISSCLRSAVTITRNFVKNSDAVVTLERVRCLPRGRA